MINQYRFILTGAQGEGKTTFAKQLIDLLSEKHNIGGLLSHGFWKNNMRDRFEIEDIMTGTRELICNTNPGKNDIQFRHFYFKESGFIFGDCAIQHALEAQAEIILIDEIGPLELEGKGWAGNLNKILISSCRLVIFVVRRALVEAVVKKWSMQQVDIIDTGKIKPEVVKAMIEKIL